MKYLNDEQVTKFNSDGYLIVKNLFSSAEADKLYHIAKADTEIDINSYAVNDQSGKRTKLTLWYTPGDDVYGLLTRSERMVYPVDQLIDGEGAVCHFHSKLMQKEPKVGGAWEWHQDYGYWYRNEFLFPNQMMSVMVAITEATRQNGCLQVIKGSHHTGRVEHGFAGEQAGASQHYIDLMLKTLELVYVELMPGDALFFHSNLVHRSEANLSDTARWSLISCYNRQGNKPYNEKSLSCITPLNIIKEVNLLDGDVRGLSGETDFLSKEMDVSLK